MSEPANLPVRCGVLLHLRVQPFVRLTCVYDRKLNAVYKPILSKNDNALNMLLASAPACRLPAAPCRQRYNFAVISQHICFASGFCAARQRMSIFVQTSTPLKHGNVLSPR
jgi:hypothetical protein